MGLSQIKSNVSEGHPNPQLDLPRCERCCGFSEQTAVRHVGIHRPKVHVIEHVQEVKPELKISLLSKPWQMVVLQEAGIHLRESGVAVDVALKVALLSGRWRREVSHREDSVLEACPAV